MARTPPTPQAGVPQPHPTTSPCQDSRTPWTQPATCSRGRRQRRSILATLRRSAARCRITQLGDTDSSIKSCISSSHALYVPLLSSQISTK